MRIKTTTKSDRIELLTILLKMGYKWHGDDNFKTSGDIESRYPSSNWPCVDIGGDDNEADYMSGCPNTRSTCEYPQDVLSILKLLATGDIVIEVPNIGDYTAKVHKDKIVVGCQTVSFKAFEELVKAFNKQNGN